MKSPYIEANVVLFADEAFRFKCDVNAARHELFSVLRVC